LLFTGSRALKVLEKFHLKVLLNEEYTEIESENYFEEITVEYLERFYNEATREIARCDDSKDKKRFEKDQDLLQEYRGNLQKN
jgi:hypothetical protein